MLRAKFAGSRIRLVQAHHSIRIAFLGRIRWVKKHHQSVNNASPEPSNSAKHILIIIHAIIIHAFGFAQIAPNHTKLYM